MTDRSGVLGDWRVVLAGCLAVLTAGAVTLVVRTGDPATADTYLSDARNAALQLKDGRLVDAVDGMRVPDGATVLTGDGGAAQLGTAGREVYLGGLTTVRVVDGVHQQLLRGQVMVDGRGAPHLALDTRAGKVGVDAGALARVEQGMVLRLGVFTGSARLTAAGRQATTRVPALYQSRAAYGAVAGTPTALALTDDPWERMLVSDLVSSDLDLRALARGLAGQSGTVVLESASARLRVVPPAFADRGEQALAVAVAEAAHHGNGDVDTLRTVEKARGEGGSWGVVAALVSARVSAVSAVLDAVLAPPGQNPLVAGGPGPDLAGLFSPGSGNGGGHRGSPTPTHSPSPRPKPKPTSPSPTSAVDQLVSTITGLVSPTPSTSNPLPTPTPTFPIHIGPIPILNIPLLP